MAASELKTAKSSTALASPAERPEAEVVIYDGKCKFCTGQVQRLARWDNRGRLAYLSLHDPRVAERYPELTHEQLMDALYLVTRDGRYLPGAAAFRYLSRRLPTLWWLAPLLHIPFALPLWQWCYQQVAKRRYRLGKVDDCDDGACEVHLRK